MPETRFQSKKKTVRYLQNWFIFSAVSFSVPEMANGSVRLPPPLALVGTKRAEAVPGDQHTSCSGHTASPTLTRFGGIVGGQFAIIQSPHPESNQEPTHCSNLATFVIDPS